MMRSPWGSGSVPVTELGAGGGGVVVGGLVVVEVPDCASAVPAYADSAAIVKPSANLRKEFRIMSLLLVRVMR
jgi:hypothetical protein